MAMQENIIEAKLKKAFLIGVSTLQLQDDCDEHFPSPTDRSVIACYKAIQAAMGDDTGYEPLQLTVDAFWAFIHKFDAAELN